MYCCKIIFWICFVKIREPNKNENHQVVGEAHGSASPNYLKIHNKQIQNIIFVVKVLWALRAHSKCNRPSSYQLSLNNRQPSDGPLLNGRRCSYPVLPAQ